MEKTEPAVLRGVLGGEMVDQRNAVELCIFKHVSSILICQMENWIKMTHPSVKDPMKVDWKGATKPER